MAVGGAGFAIANTTFSAGTSSSGSSSWDDFSDFYSSSS